MPNPSSKVTPKVYIALPIVVLAILAWILRLDYPLYDYWSMLSYFAKQESSLSPTIASYFAPFGDGIMLGSSMFIDAFSYATHGKYFFIHTAFCILCVLLSLILVSKVISAQTEISGGSLDRNTATGLKIVASLLLFWPVNIVLFQHHWYALQYGIVYVCGFGGIYLLSQENIGSTITGILVLVFAALSHNTLVILLPCIAFTYLLMHRSVIRRAAVSTALVLIFLFMLWLIPSREVMGHPPLLDSLSHPLLFKFFLYLFAPRFLETVLGPLIAIILVFGAFLFFMRLRRTGEEIWFIWLTLTLWVFAVAILISIGRITVLGFYVQYWYFFFMVIGWVVAATVLSMVGQDYGVFNRIKKHRYMMSVLCIPFIVIYVYGSIGGMKTAYVMQVGAQWSGKRLQAAHYLSPEDTRFLSFADHWYFLKIHFRSLYSRSDIFPSARLGPFAEFPIAPGSVRIDGGRLLVTAQDDPYVFKGLSISTEQARKFSQFAHIHYLDGDSAMVDIKKRLLADRHYVIGVLPDDVPSEVKFLSDEYTHSGILKVSMERSEKKIQTIEFEFAQNGSAPTDVKDIIQGIKVLK